MVKNYNFGSIYKKRKSFQRGISTKYLRIQVISLTAAYARDIMMEIQCRVFGEFLTFVAEVDETRNRHFIPEEMRRNRNAKFEAAYAVIGPKSRETSEVKGK